MFFCFYSFFQFQDVDGYDTFSVIGPDTLSLNNTGLWTVTAAMHDLYCDLALDILTPLDLPGVMSVDSVSISSVGKMPYCIRIILESY